MIQRAKRRAILRQRRIQQSRKTKQHNKPRPLNPRLALQRNRRPQRQRNDPQRARQLDRRSNRQRRRAVFRRRPHHGTRVVNRQRRPQSKLLLRHVQHVPKKGKQKKRHRIQDEHHSHGHAHLIRARPYNRPHGCNPAPSANRRSRADQKRRLSFHAQQRSKPQPHRHGKKNTRGRVHKSRPPRVQNFVQVHPKSQRHHRRLQQNPRPELAPLRIRMRHRKSKNQPAQQRDRRRHKSTRRHNQRRKKNPLANQRPLLQSQSPHPALRQLKLSGRHSLGWHSQPAAAGLSVFALTQLTGRPSLIRSFIARPRCPASGAKIHRLPAT